MAYLPLLFYLLSMDVVCSSWNITIEANPGCIQNCSQFNLVHIAARHSGSSVHFLLASSERIGPSVLALESSDPEASLIVNWTLITNDADVPVEAIKLDNVHQSYGVVFTHLVEYNDKTDIADMAWLSSDANEYRTYQFNRFRWSMAPLARSSGYVLSDREIFHVTFTGNSSDSLFHSNGSIKIEFMISNADQHNTIMPRLQFVAGLSLQFELHLIGLQTNFTAGRFATQLGLVSQESVGPHEDFVQTTEFSISDEVTPGVFKMINVYLGKRTNSMSGMRQNSSRLGGFIQTRPVCYISDGNREVKTSRDARLSPRRNSINWSNSRPPDSLARSLPYWFYGSRMETVGVRVQNVSFGTSEDGYYARSNYIVWSASFGLGEPPVESLSGLLIGLISLSTVVILGSLVFGTLVLLVVRWRGTRSNRESEPLLEPPSNSETA